MIELIPFTSLTEKQKKMVFQWRNDEHIRTWMIHSEPIAWKDHCAFIENLKNDQTRFYFLVIYNEDYIGVVNLKVFDEETLEGGLYKCPDVQYPVGKQLIDALEEKAKNIGYRKVLLEVQFRNTRAIRLYENNGYRVFDFKNQYYYMIKSLFSTPFIVAELSANHNHDIEIAKKTIQAAAECGADAVKIQTYTADTITIDCDNEYFRIEQGTIWDGSTLYDLYKEAYTPWEWHDELQQLAKSLGLIFFSTPFDKTAVDFLEEKNVPLYKIASFEITDIPLIEYIASKRKPVVISIGIADLSDIHAAVEACRRAGNNEITLLQCTSSYPAPVDKANLNMIPSIAKTFNVNAGLSDHTIGSAVAVAAVALGATFIEKHFILDRNIGGPDAQFSMEPDEFKSMVQDIRTVTRALGDIDYSLTKEKKNSRNFARSLFVVNDIQKGEKLTQENVRSIRPGYGIHPKHFSEVLSRCATRELKRGEPLSWDMIE